MNEIKEKPKRKPGPRTVILIVWLVLLAALLAGILLCLPAKEKAETIQEVMLDGVLHEHNHVQFLGLTVNPAVISAYGVTAVLLLLALLARIFVIPRFSADRPGRLQSLLELAVGFFDGLARKNSPHRPNIVGAYIFSAGVYISVSTLFELFGIQVLTTEGLSVALPAPISDINAAIAMGVTSYLFILGGGIVCGGARGALSVLKDFSLPISMSFRLFGALLSGLLVTELVYYYVALSFVLPVLVGVLFTLLHAVIQTYVLSTLVSIFYGEAVEAGVKSSHKKAGKAAGTENQIKEKKVERQ